MCKLRERDVSVMVGKRYFQGHEYGMSATDYANNDGALLNGFLGVFDLEDAALGRAVDL